jgi:formylglycine-generating enzyme
MGRSTNGGRDYAPLGDSDELPEHTAIVGDFRLDRFEVTVSRFRQFVAAYAGPPEQGAGAHPIVPSSGWNVAWNSAMPADRAALIASLKCTGSTWSDQPAGKEDFPITCLTWYAAFAFCTWDGGRLPTEAEWEYAAAGGNENRMYPWGEGDETVRVIGGRLAAVGSSPTGAGRWGQEDLAGSVWEWVLDAYASDWYARGTCSDCANLMEPTSERVARGGAYVGAVPDRRAAARNPLAPTARAETRGVRCARRY